MGGGGSESVMLSVNGSMCVQEGVKAGGCCPGVSLFTYTPWLLFFSLYAVFGKCESECREPGILRPK